jgi:hypothetical protein
VYVFKMSVELLNPAKVFGGTSFYVASETVSVLGIFVVDYEANLPPWAFARKSFRLLARFRDWRNDLRSLVFMRFGPLRGF